MQPVTPVMGKNLRQLVGEVGFLTPLGDLDDHVVVRGVAIHDPTFDPKLAGAGDLVLGVGLSAPDVSEAADHYVRFGASALAVRCDAVGDVGDLPVLRVAPDVDWATLHLALDTAIHVSDRLGTSVPTGIEGLFSLSEVLAANLEGPVVIHDRNWRMLAYASGGYDIDEMGRRTILNRRAPEAWLETIRESGGFAEIDAGKVLHLTDGPFRAALRARALVAIRAGGERLGTLCVIHPRTLPVDDLEHQMIEGARLAALQIVRSRILNVATTRAETEALAALIAGEPASQNALLTLGMGGEAHYLVAAIRPQPENDLALAVMTERLISMTRTMCDAYRLRNVCSATDGVIYVLIGTDSADARPAVVEIFEGIRRRAQASGNAVQVALGASVPTLDRFAESLSSLRALLGLLTEGTIPIEYAADHAAHVLRVEYSQIRGILRGASAQSEHAMTLPEGLRADRQVVETLTHFFDCGGDIHETARALDIHPNTVRYRLRKLREVYGIDVADPVQKFIAEMKIRLHRD